MGASVRLIILSGLFIAGINVAAFAAPKWLPFAAGTSEITVDVVEETEQHIILRYQIPGIRHENFEYEGRALSKIRIPGTSVLNYKGYPELPFAHHNIIIRWEGLPQVEVIAQEEIQINISPVAPSLGPFNWGQKLASHYDFSSFYATGQLFPQASVALSYPFNLRSKRGITVRIFPARYDRENRVLRVMKTMTVKISGLPMASGDLEFERRREEENNSFSRVYERSFINYNPLVGDFLSAGDPNLNAIRNLSLETSIDVDRFEDWEEDLQETPRQLPRKTASTVLLYQSGDAFGNILVISNNQFLARMQRFRDWKQQRGFNVFTVSVDDIGNNSQAIFQAIKTYYANNRIEYVVLVGDHDVVATYKGTVGNVLGEEADPLYSLVEGNDSYPDLFVSRISVNRIDELDTVLEKILVYEKYPDVGGTWYEKATLVASADSGYVDNFVTPRGFGLTDLERAEQLRQTLKTSYRIVDQIYDPNASKEKLIQALQDGRGFLSYTGHGLETNWETTGFSITDIDALEIDRKYPLIISVGCVNGDFDYSFGDSFAEKWVKAGTKENPNGAIAVFASSTNQSWIPPTIGQRAIVSQLVRGEKTTVGELFMHGSVAVLDHGSWTAEQTFQSWHIFGDASLQVRTKKPERIPYSFDQPVLYPDQTVQLLVTPEVMVTLWQGGQIFFRAKYQQQPARNSRRVDEITQSQRFPLNIPIQALTHDPLIVTLSGYNKIPLSFVYTWDSAVAGFLITPFSRPCDEGFCD